MGGFHGHEDREGPADQRPHPVGPVWPELSPDEPGRAAAAHRGYLSRARGIAVEQLYAEARRRGKRLVLCGALPLWNGWPLRWCCNTAHRQHSSLTCHLRTSLHHPYDVRSRP